LRCRPTEGWDEDELPRLHQALSHPHRRKIIHLLGSRGPMSFSELKRSLGISIGALYYNLDQLSGLVAQASDKRYLLTEKGVAAYNFMRGEGDLLEEAGSRFSLPPQASRLFNAVRSLFFPRELLSSLYAGPSFKLKAAAAAVLALGALACALTGTDVFLTYVRVGFKGRLILPELGIYLEADPRLLSASSFIATWLTLSLFPYAVASLLKWEWGWRKLASFLEGSAVGMLPALAYVVIYSAALRAGAQGYLAVAALGVVFAVLWAMMIGFIAASLSMAKRISASRALLIMVVVAYLCMASQQGILVKWILQR